jgi:hypothetical protein
MILGDGEIRADSVQQRRGKELGFTQVSFYALVELEVEVYSRLYVLQYCGNDFKTGSVPGKKLDVCCRADVGEYSLNNQPFLHQHGQESLTQRD